MKSIKKYLNKLKTLKNTNIKMPNTQQTHTLPSRSSQYARHSLSKSVSEPNRYGKRKSNKNLSLPDKKEEQNASKKNIGERTATKIQSSRCPVSHSPTGAPLTFTL
jgi:hypothetical protein